MNKNLKMKKATKSKSNIGIVNYDTGEVTDLNYGDKIVHAKESYVTNDDRALVLFSNKQERFNKMYHNTMRALKYILTPKESIAFVELTTYMRMFDGCIIIDDNYADIKSMSEVLEIDYNNFRKYIKKYINLDLIHKRKQDNRIVYVVNPYLFTNSQYITEDLINDFSKTIWASNDLKTMRREDFQKYLETQ